MGLQAVIAVTQEINRVQELGALLAQTGPDRTKLPLRRRRPPAANAPPSPSPRITVAIGAKVGTAYSPMAATDGCPAASTARGLCPTMPPAAAEGGEGM